MKRALMLLALVACGGPEESDGPAPVEDVAPPVLIFGLDGFEWSVALPLLQAGRMPTLAGLMERGTYGTLATLEPTKSPRLWTTLATGKVPEKHGILDFVKPREERGPKQLYTRMDRKTKAFWNILADEGLTSDTIGWWMTYPPERVPGLMVAQTNTRRKKGELRKGSLRGDTEGQVWPPEAEAGILELLEQHEAALPALTAEIFGAFGTELTAERAERWDQCQWAFRADSTYAAVLEQRLAEGAPSRVSAIYLGGTDVVGHRFWSSYRPEPFQLAPDSDEVRTFGHVIPSYYAYVDQVLGRLLAQYPADTSVFVITDHGMSSFLPDMAESGEPLDPGKTGGHKGDPGIFVAAGFGVRAGGPLDLDALTPQSMPSLGGLVDFTPTLLTLLGLAYGEDMDGAPLEGVLTDEIFGSARAIATHDDDGWLATQDPNFVRTDAERVQQLENMGYLGGGVDGDEGGDGGEDENE
ncbi:MAG: alkaline phosphatase family protein [Planctomycetota bacterium]|nr:alkaline phosphatase family protein [Planctomycetota bacterium]